MDYYSRPEVSNSDLSKLKQDLQGSPKIDPTEAYLFGSIVDAMITEPSEINYFSKTYKGVEIEKKIWSKALNCKNAFNASKYSHLIKGAIFQKVSVKSRLFNWNGIEFWLDCRAKWDFFGSHISGDIKTTTARTQSEFEAACKYFDYFRQRAWYMDLEQTNIDVLIGISKENYKVFAIAIYRGDENYQLGLEQYWELAFKYHVLKNSIGI